MSTTTANYSAGKSIWLVAEREILVRLRSVSFLVSTGITLLIVIGSIVAGVLIAQNQESSRVAIVTGVNLPAGVEFSETIATDRSNAEDLLLSGEIDAAIIPDSGPLGFAVLAQSSPPLDVLQALSVTPPVELLNPEGNLEFFISYLASVAFGLLFFLSAMTFGGLIAQTVLEEKQTRVVEILLATVSARTLLSGKIIGNTILAVAQIVLMIGIALIGLNATGQAELLNLLGSSLLWFAVFFVFGFLLLAALFAASGAMVSRAADLGSTTTPVTMLVMLPYFLVIIFNDNPLMLSIMSYVPFSAPVAMPLRIFLGEVSAWEPLLSLAVLILTCLLMIIAGARIYENSLLRIGARVKLGEALRG